MAKLRKFVAYRHLERPYTRKSKYKKKAFVKASPGLRIVRFNLGDQKKKFTYSVFLKTKSALQIRSNSIESARQVSNRVLENKLGKTNYRMTVRIYPHHILREHSLASGAGADRTSTGMAHAYGKPVGLAAQLKKGAIIFHVEAEKQHLPTVMEALHKAATKLPCSCLIEPKLNK